MIDERKAHETSRLRVAVALAFLAPLAALPALTASACGGVSVKDKESPTTSEVLVSADGGRVDGPLGSYVIVPPGALTADTPIGIALADDSTYQAQPDAAVSRGAVFAFTPHGLVFQSPAEIGIPSSATPDETNLVLRAADNAAPWTLGPSATFDDAGFATFNTTQFSLYTVVSAGDGGIDSIFPGGSGCSPDQRDLRWSAMLAAPIVLPGRAGTLDLAGDDKAGISLTAAQAALCGGDSRGAINGGDTETVAWGPAGDFAVVFDKATLKARFAIVTGGCTGTLEFGGAGDADAGAGDGGAAGWVVRLGVPIAKAGAPITIPWGDQAALGALMNELERAMLATFFPGEPAPATPCDAPPARCSPGTLGSSGYLSFAKPGVTIWVGDTASADRASTPSRIDVYARPTP